MTDALPLRHSRKDTLLLGVGHHNAAVLVDQASPHEVVKSLQGRPTAVTSQGFERRSGQLFRIIPGHEPAHSANVRPEDAEDARYIADGDLHVGLTPDHRAWIRRGALEEHAPDSLVRGRGAVGAVVDDQAVEFATLEIRPRPAVGGEGTSCRPVGCREVILGAREAFRVRDVREIEATAQLDQRTHDTESPPAPSLTSPTHRPHRRMLPEVDAVPEPVPRMLAALAPVVADDDPREIHDVRRDSVTSKCAGRSASWARPDDGDA